MEISNETQATQWGPDSAVDESTIRVQRTQQALTKAPKRECFARNSPRSTIRMLSTGILVVLYGPYGGCTVWSIRWRCAVSAHEKWRCGPPCEGSMMEPVLLVHAYDVLQEGRISIYILRQCFPATAPGHLWTFTWMAETTPGKLMIQLFCVGNPLASMATRHW